MKILSIFVCMITLTSCLEKEGTNNIFDPKDGAEQYYYKRIEDGNPLTGDENLILRCTNSIAGGFCESVCISSELPQFKRYTLAMSNYEADGKCFIYIFGFNPQDGSLPIVRHYRGDYVVKMVNGSTKGFCENVSVSSPDFEGLWQFGDDRANEYLNLYNSEDELYKSILLNINQGDVFTYFDPDYMDDITIQTRQGYECRKESELSDELIKELAI